MPEPRPPLPVRPDDPVIRTIKGRTFAYRSATSCTALFETLVARFGTALLIITGALLLRLPRNSSSPTTAAPPRTMLRTITGTQVRNFAFIFSSLSSTDLMIEQKLQVPIAYLLRNCQTH